MVVSSGKTSNGDKHIKKVKSSPMFCYLDAMCICHMDCVHKRLTCQYKVHMSNTIVLYLHIALVKLIKVSILTHLETPSLLLPSLPCAAILNINLVLIFTSILGSGHFLTTGGNFSIPPARGVQIDHGRPT